MYYKFKVDIGIRQYAWMIFMIVVIVGIFSFVGSIFEIATMSKGISDIFIAIGCFVAFIYTIKEIVESFFIVPASEYEKEQIKKEEKKEEEKSNGSAKRFLK